MKRTSIEHYLKTLVLELIDTVRYIEESNEYKPLDNKTLRLGIRRALYELLPPKGTKQPSAEKLLKHFGALTPETRKEIIDSLSKQVDNL